MAFSPDLRFSINDRFEGEAEAESSLRDTAALDSDRDSTPHHSDHASSEEDKERGEEKDGFVEGMDPDGFAGPKIMKPLTPEALAAYQAAQNKTGVIYISRIPPGMRPTKVRHIMSQYGEVGRVYLQQEDAKRAYLRRKYTSTKKVHYTEGWVEFKDKKIARSVAEMLNAQPIGGKKGTRWRDDIWTMKYLPKFKWHMLTEQVAHEAAIRTARLRLELSQSRTEQRDYLKNVELARVLKKRAERKRAAGKEMPARAAPTRNEKREADVDFEQSAQKRKKRAEPHEDGRQLDSVLKSIF